MKKITILCFLAANLSLWAQQHRIRSIAAERIEVSPRYDENPIREVMEIISPYKASVDSVMAPVLGSSRTAMAVHRPESLLSNWVADMMVETSAREGIPTADMGLMNMGGLRNNMPKGIIRRGDIMLISPFENHVVVLEMKGSDLMELFENIAFVHGEGVSSSVRLEISKEGKLLSATLAGEEINPEKTYHVATLDYLSEGNDRMTALKKHLKKHETGLLLREAMMENITQHRVIDSKIEGRIVIK